MKNAKLILNDGNLTSFKAFYLYAFILLGTMLFSSNSFAQTPNIITYQGKLTMQGTDVSGETTIIARLYTDAEGTERIWEGTYKTYVTDGIFALPLGAGKHPLPAPTKLDKQLWVGITIDGIELRPLTQLTSSPYALNVADKSITKAKLADELVTSLVKQDPQTDPNGTSNWHEDGNHSISNTGNEYLGTKDATYLLIKVGADSSATGGYGRVMWYNPNGTSANILGGHNSNTIANGFGNVISGGGRYLHPNSIGTHASTSFAYLGGGEDNSLTGFFAVLVGGERDTVVGNNSFLGGGRDNNVGTSTNSSDESVIIGGVGNTTTGDRATILGGQGLTLSGDNVVGFNASSGVTFSGSNAMFLNDIDVRISNSSNSAKRLIFHEPSSDATGNITTFKAQTQTADIDYILPNAQGASNTFLRNDGSGTLSWADPLANGVNAWNLTGNSGTTPPTNFLGTIDTAAFEIRVNNSGSATQGRQRVMRYEPNDVSPNILGGFNGNTITPGKVGSVIAGGGASGSINQIIKDFGFIGGGINNSVKDSLGVIVGGSNNTISNASSLSFIGGGDSNTIESSTHSVIVGGRANEATGKFAFVGGGEKNLADGGAGFGVVVGGRRNTAIGGASFVGGGGANFGDDSTTGNQASSPFTVVVGGRSNLASGNHAFVGGGDSNVVTMNSSAIVAGTKNRVNSTFSFIGGGSANRIILGEGQATHMAIPGGDSLVAQSYAQTVIGAFNIAQGASNDRNYRGQAQGFTSTDSSRIGHTNDRLFIIGNGVLKPASTDDSLAMDTITRSNAFEVFNKGIAVVYGSLNSRGPDAPTFPDPANPSRDSGSAPPINIIGDPAILGATCQDNIIYAWADVPAPLIPATSPQDIRPNSSYGVKKVTYTSPNEYEIILKNEPSSTDPKFNPSNQPKLNQASIVATLVTTDAGNATYCGSIKVTRITNNVFKVFTFDQSPTTTIVLTPNPMPGEPPVPTPISTATCTKEALPFMVMVTGRP